MSKKKKIIIALIVTILLSVGCVALVTVLKNKTKEKKQVDVYSVAEIAMDASMMEYDNYFSGNVSVSMEQKVTLSSADLIDETMVKEGQQVKAGDVILTYDMTAKELELDILRASVEQARVDVLVAERELKELKEIVPVEELPEEPVTEAPTTEEPTTEAPIDDELPDEVPSEEVASPTDAIEEPLDNEELTGNSSLEEDTTPADVFMPGEDGMYEDMDQLEEPEDVTYTKSELDKMIKEKEREISNLNINYQLEQIELEMLEYQSENRELLCNFDGVVTKVNDPEEAIANGEPYIVIVGDKGCTVEASVGELSLSNVTIGEKVTMFCYDTGMEYTGTISEISTTPVESYYYGSSIESYYPITIVVEGGENLSPGMYMEIQRESTTENGFYLPLAFVMSEGGQYYVMKDNNGVLEKVYIKTGKILWGDSIKVLGGISMGDYIAFPYASDVKEGVKTQMTGVDSLYY
ncbi:MAG: HlyD family efflux transporter periplasmic adaptor subunit [Lachnospiraceae bacterium]|nr:HlyD family efflux transporter periplasmic adaptor subunit [Lachnospiraceae bacterium]